MEIDKGTSEFKIDSFAFKRHRMGLHAVTKPAFKGRGEPDQMGVAATPKCKMDAYWMHSERKKLGGFDQKHFDHHAFYVGYNVTNVFYSAIKATKGVWELAPR